MTCDGDTRKQPRVWFFPRSRFSLLFSGEMGLDISSHQFCFGVLRCLGLTVFGSQLPLGRRGAVGSLNEFVHDHFVDSFPATHTNLWQAFSEFETVCIESRRFEPNHQTSIVHLPSPATPTPNPTAGEHARAEQLPGQHSASGASSVAGRTDTRLADAASVPAVVGGGEL